MKRLYLKYGLLVPGIIMVCLAGCTKKEKPVESLPALSKAYKKQPFHIINLSLPKSGSSSISGIFSGYRSYHEGRLDTTLQKIFSYRRHELSKEGLQKYLINRANALKPEVDSATFFHTIPRLTVDSFPDSRYLVCIRRADRWTLSALAELVSAVNRGTDLPAWFQDYTSMVTGHNSAEQFSLDRDFKEDINAVLPDFVAYWGRSNLKLLKVMAAQPPEKLLVIRTNELSHSLNDLAELAGVEPASLKSRQSHLNRGRRKQIIQKVIDEKRLRRLAEKWQRRVDVAMAELGTH